METLPAEVLYYIIAKLDKLDCLNLRSLSKYFLHLVNAKYRLAIKLASKDKIKNSGVTSC